ncbi:methyl-accepting chemotaxis protein [Rhodopirellula sallentina]|uniref:Methyl-accepting chemotaxis sensory transducer n=1 Tax=Rhodopirellula sallentina SM41 TaxID=1263870 RepID=M5TUD9_9BACT|nr:methyl-accepting chemotaxis protein [Rhodopirellula sallentina]EMI52775.1 methyl-accepting chemotaxis sensory transducer [Rhodopirellula sallentina SM41]
MTSATSAASVSRTANENPSAPGSTDDSDFDSNEKLTTLIQDLARAVGVAIDEIDTINARTKLLSLNARIEASRAGAHGAAFGVVAQEIQTLSQKTGAVADEMASITKSRVDQLMQIIETNIRGVRLSDLALNCVDLIDRNLYERTCDVRWWATDSSVVNALSEPTKESLEYAAQRLGVILDAYTVYYDLVICNRDGIVVANGRKSQFDSVGCNVSNSDWYSQAMDHSTGNEFGFESANASELADRQHSLVYSCSVREQGIATMPTVGVLGAVFNWDGLAKPILDDLPIAECEQNKTVAYILDPDGNVLAYRSGTEPLSGTLPCWETIRSESKGFFIDQYRGKKYCIGHAKAPGFETYSTDWIAVVMQEM